MYYVVDIFVAQCYFPSLKYSLKYIHSLIQCTHLGMLDMRL